MNALDVMRYGHGTVLETIKRVPASNWMDNGVCGVWSTRDLLSHLASYELVLVDILGTLTDNGDTPYLDKILSPDGDFNDSQVDNRQHQSGEESLAEYTSAYERVSELASRMPHEIWSQVGSIPWYGPEYSLDDLIAYQYYGHKREHSAQIAVFSDRFE